uniref:Uncharacterized protein n=1 Tax=Arundo donax TaxID=35708 RepID=A0A0A9HDL8_ARUDO
MQMGHLQKTGSHEPDYQPMMTYLILIETEMGDLVVASYEDQMHLQKQLLIEKTQKLNCHQDHAVQWQHEVQHYLPLCQLNHSNYPISLTPSGSLAEHFHLLYILQHDEPV